MDNLQKVNKYNKAAMYMMPLMVSLGNTAIGYFLVYLTMIKTQIAKANNMESSQMDFAFVIATSMVPFGAFIGSFLIDRMCDKYGENTSMIMMNVVAITSIVAQMFSQWIPILMVTRFMMGIYCGIMSGIIPAYLVSISPPKISGLVGSYNQLFIVFGMALAYFMGDILQSHTMQNSTILALYIFTPFTCIVVQFIGCCMFPFDTLERHLKKRQYLTFNKYMAFFYGDKWREYHEEVVRFKKMPDPAKPFEEDQEEQRCPNKKFIALGIALALVNQLTGINAILIYAKQLFLKVENNDIPGANTWVNWLGFTQIIATIAGGFLVNHFGRRVMMLVGQSVMVVSLLVGFLLGVFDDVSHETNMVPVIFLHIVAYSISLGPICMLYAAQTLKSMQLVVTITWFMILLISLTAQEIILRWGPGYMFLLYFILSTLGLIYVYLKIFETSNKPKMQIWRQVQQQSIFGIQMVKKQDDKQMKSIDVSQVVKEGQKANFEGEKTVKMEEYQKM